MHTILKYHYDVWTNHLRTIQQATFHMMLISGGTINWPDYLTAVPGVISPGDYLSVISNLNSYTVTFHSLSDYFLPFIITRSTNSVEGCYHGLQL